MSSSPLQASFLKIIASFHTFLITDLLLLVRTALRKPFYSLPAPLIVSKIILTDKSLVIIFSLGARVLLGVISVTAIYSISLYTCWSKVISNLDNCTLTYHFLDFDGLFRITSNCNYNKVSFCTVAAGHFYIFIKDYTIDSQDKERQRQDERLLV